jgi:hypothetical protein
LLALTFVICVRNWTAPATRRHAAAIDLHSHYVDAYFAEARQDEMSPASHCSVPFRFSAFPTDRTPEYSGTSEPPISCSARFSLCENSTASLVA